MDNKSKEREMQAEEDKEMAKKLLEIKKAHELEMKNKLTMKSPAPVKPKRQATTFLPLRRPRTFLHDWGDFIAQFNRGWAYPTRPVMLNHLYKCKLSDQGVPSLFFVEIHDETNKWIRTLVDKECEMFRPVVEKNNAHMSAKIECLNIPMLPVVVRINNRFVRGEVNSFDEKKWMAAVCLVDMGMNLLVAVTNIFPPSAELFRYPKLTMPCELPHVVPANGAKDWTDCFFKQLSIRRIRGSITVKEVNLGKYTVYLEQKSIDIGFNLVNMKVADFTTLEKTAEGASGVYPLFDYSPWIGQKIPVFGTGVSVSRNIVTLYLQLDTELASSTADSIEGLKNLTPMAKLKPGTEKGKPVIVVHEEITYRGTILAKIDEKYQVRLVDYGDIVMKEVEDLYKLPRRCAIMPELATPCIIAETLQDGFIASNFEKCLEILIKDQNLYGVLRSTSYVDSSDPNGETVKCLISLALPVNLDTGKEVPFSSFLKLPPYTIPERMYHDEHVINQSLATMLFSQQSPYISGVKYSAVFTNAQDLDCWNLQLEGDDIRCEVLNTEMTDYYTTFAPTILPELLWDGFYVAVWNENRNQWCRGRIIEIIEDPGCYKIRHIDIGTEGWVTMKEIKPLVTYFCREPVLSRSYWWPLRYNPNHNRGYVYLFLLTVMKDAETLTVTLQQEKGQERTYVYIMANGKSLPLELIENGLARYNFTPPSEHEKKKIFYR